MDVSIVVPCFNEVDLVDALVGALDAACVALEAGGRHAEAIVVDDGSTDGSFDRLAQAAAGRPHLRLVRLRRNFGQTAALKAGFDHARGDVLVPMDADGQNDAADIPKLLAKLDEGYDVVSGWRRRRQDTWLTRVLPSKIANRLIGAISGVRLRDYGCTLKAYRRAVIAPVRLYGEMHRFIPIFASWNGARITEMEVLHHPRRAGRSKYGVGRTFKVLLDLATVKFLADYSTKPIYLFGGAGLVSFAVSMGAAATALWQKLALGVKVHRNPLALLAAVLAVVGVQFVLMGLLAELLVRTWHESQDKPVYLVRETRNVDAEANP
ncbi:MAG: glycosyltransferase family 2 protein [Myxococcota bacterium]